jgi:hypothetical protein
MKYSSLVTTLHRPKSCENLPSDRIGWLLLRGIYPLTVVGLSASPP